MMPLFIHENYLRVTPSETKKGMNKIESDLKKYADAADSISEGDIISRTIYSDQNFEILPVYGVISSIRPTSLISGFVGNRIEFPVILGKISTINKRKRLLNEVKYEIHRTTMGSTSKSLALERFNLMYDKLVDPLIEEGKDGIDEVINFMRTYNLSQEGRDNIIELCEYGGQKGKYKSNKVDSQVKNGMSVGDKGGLAELNQMIKTTRIPIICLCNDKYKVRTLANSANVLHLPFRRPTVAQVKV